MTSLSKNVYIDKLDVTVNEYNNKYHRTIKMKTTDVKDNAYVDSIKEVNDKDKKNKVGDHVRISKYKNKLKIQFHGQMLLMILIMKKSSGHFMKKNCKRLIKSILG